VSDDDLVLFGLQYGESNHVCHNVLKAKANLLAPEFYI
jgi:hypothetical protein